MGLVRTHIHFSTTVTLYATLLAVFCEERFLLGVLESESAVAGTRKGKK